MTKSTARIIRVFLASPGDVTEERAQARHLVKDDLPTLPSIKDKAWLKIVAWEDPSSRAPMPATLSPQKAIELGMTRPSDCDIVVVVFWSRMGTPLDEAQHGLKDDIRPYWSGTEWEYYDALKASETTGKPVVLVYRRTAEVPLNPEWHDFDERVEQLKRVREFFATFRDANTGAWLRSYTEYATPEQFGEMLKTDLLHYIQEILEEESAAPVRESEEVPKRPEWKGSPFPGLRAFTPDDAPIFFGRDQETDALLKRVNESRFVAVVGASGSGKSSLVGAGLIPRLMDNAIPGSKDWLWRRFTPGEVGDNPFGALAMQLAPLTGHSARDITAKLTADPGAPCAICEKALEDKPDWAELVLFIDQFEELFTVVQPKYCIPFIELLTYAASCDHVRLVLTLRADFYHRCVEYPRLAQLLREGSFPLSAPELDALLVMIERPAAIAGLVFDEGLPGRILRDTGQEPGALALMAYTLDELYKLAETRDDHSLTFEDYEALGGVEQAIGTRAENTYAGLGQSAKDTLPRVFRELVTVDEHGTATRQRVSTTVFEGDTAAMTLLNEFTDARLLMQSRGEDNRPIVEVAHEALFHSWPRLAEWIENAKFDLMLLAQLKTAVEDWKSNDYRTEMIWPLSRLTEVHELLGRVQLPLSEEADAFILNPSITEQHQQPRTRTKNPFLGLRPFTADDAGVFVGFNTEVDELVERVLRHRFVVVVGPSGVGKSSLVHAGLVRKLTSTVLGREWILVRCTPGSNPLHVLASAFSQDDQTAAELERVLSDDANALPVLCQRILEGRPKWANILLMVDQLEELFTLVNDDFRHHFINLLTTAASVERLRTVATLRSDFYTHSLESDELARLFRDGSFALPPRTKTALYEIVTRMADHAGQQFEAGLPEQILHDAGEGPVALPLIAFTLDELYRASEANEGGGVLTHAAYMALGGVQGSLSTHAEDFFNTLRPEEQKLVPDLFRALIAVDATGTPTRRIVRRDLIADSPEKFHLLDKAIRRRLLAVGQADDETPTIEIVHEALLYRWPRLSQWLEEARDDMLLMQMLHEATDIWEANGRNSAYLWREERLDLLEPALERLRPSMNPAECDFIDAHYQGHSARSWFLEPMKIVRRISGRS